MAEKSQEKINLNRYVIDRFEGYHPNYLKVRFDKIMKFWERKKVKIPDKKIKKKQKVANQKLRILGQFYAYEKAL